MRLSVHHTRWLMRALPFLGFLLAGSWFVFEQAGLGLDYSGAFPGLTETNLLTFENDRKPGKDMSMEHARMKFVRSEPYFNTLKMKSAGILVDHSGIGFSLFVSHMHIGRIDENYPAVGISFDGFISKYASFNLSGSISLGLGFDAGIKVFPLGNHEKLKFQPFAGFQAGYYTFGLFTIDRFRTVTPLAGIRYFGKKGFLVGIDAGYGMVNVERIDTWGSAPDENGRYGCFSARFHIGFRFIS